MSKSILVLDNNPENCKKCCFLEYDLLGQERCSVTVKTIKDSDKKQVWCPLKPLPDKISLEKPEDYYYGKMHGWNTCIDEIIGEDNGKDM